MDDRSQEKTDERLIEAETRVEEEFSEEVCPAIDVPDPCGLVIFGASGDLTSRKLIPSLYYLFKNGLISQRFFILGTSRSKMSHEAFRESLAPSARDAHPEAFDTPSWETFSKDIYYYPMDYNDKDGFKRKAAYLRELEGEYRTAGNRLYYLAVPPFLYEMIIENLGEAKLARSSGGFSRLVIEKPFGRDLKSAHRLNKYVQRHFREEQVFRIDHYLGKETVQNVSVFRFMNAIFEPIWNRRYIDHVQITAAESLGVENRAGYYETAGILRDMFQNHMLQLLALTAMEPPSRLDADCVREEKVKIFRALRPFDLNRLDESLVLGQYGPGEIGGTPVKGYREEEGVDSRSLTPTFAAATFYIDNWRWQGVPFYLRSGKRMPRKVTEISIQFKAIPHILFEAVTEESMAPNVLILRIQPDERIRLSFQTKKRGSKGCLRRVLMDYCYESEEGGFHLDSYERVLLDAMLGDHMLFVRQDAVELSWSLLTPVIEALEGGTSNLEVSIYPAGAPGPREAADNLLEREDDRWRKL
ncbi:MAG: glucose-6-phosphate dehydrogenase [bacterium]|nr:glucose-6-phosphate dehydrogenase [bacterium]